VPQHRSVTQRRIESGEELDADSADSSEIASREWMRMAEPASSGRATLDARQQSYRGVRRAGCWNIAQRLIGASGDATTPLRRGESNESGHDVDLRCRGDAERGDRMSVHQRALVRGDQASVRWGASSRSLPRTRCCSPRSTPRSRAPVRHDLSTTSWSGDRPPSAEPNTSCRRHWPSTGLGRRLPKEMR
jgi:hypothetical protein